MSTFTFLGIEFPSPDRSWLYNIYQDGLTPLFDFWVNRTKDLRSASPAGWASSRNFIEYVQDYYEHRNRERVDHEASPSGALAVSELLAEAKGVYYFVFDDKMCFAAEFHKDRITVATTNDEPMIFCQDFDRTLWMTNFIKNLSEQKGGVFSKAETPVDTIAIFY